MSLIRVVCLVGLLGLVPVAAEGQWLDPNRVWNSDQWQHAAFGAALDVIVRGPWIARSWRDTPFKRLGWTMVLGCVVLESYQVYESQQRGWLGNSGAGFGLLDCLAVGMGGLAMEAVLSVLRF